MDNLQETIAGLMPEEIREFKLFINRQKKKKERKDLDLFYLLMENNHLKPHEITRRFYNKNNRNAYHSIRKRLFRHLTDFIVLKQIDNDATTASSVMGIISLSRFLFHRQQNRLGWFYLNKAEAIAASNEQFDLLNSIYNLKFERYMPEFGDDLKTIIRKRNENKKLLDQDERAIIAQSIIQHELNQIIVAGKEIPFERIISRVLKECDLTDVAAKRPKLLFHIASIVRSAIIANKDYSSFEPYIIELFREAEPRIFWTKSNHYYKLSLLYMISHVLYRNRKFSESEIFLQKLLDEMQQFNQLHYNLFYSDYILLLAAGKSYMGKNTEAIVIHEKVMENKVIKHGFMEEYSVRLNLAVYYFNDEKYTSANRLLLTFEHSDNWYEKRLGKEWLLRKNLIEMIVQYELGNDDISMNRIRSMERHFALFLEHSAYKRVKTFLGFVKDFFNAPEVVSTVEFEKRVTDSKIFLPDEHEDIHAIAFFCWLKAKMVKQPYYKVLVERVNKQQ